MDKKWLIPIVLLAAITRLMFLDRFPAGFTPDEATFGYDAYSLLHTGKDEWGIPFWKLPITGLMSFGDNKLPLYAFLAVPSIAIFGLNEFATRLPNAVLAIFAAPLFYVVARRLALSGKAAIFTCLLYSLSPWSISLSRGAFEANLGTTFILLGLGLFFSKKYALTGLIFSLAMYAYHTPRIIIFPMLFLLYFFFKPGKKYLITVFVFVILSAAAFWSFLNFNPRAADLSIFNLYSSNIETTQFRYAASKFGWPIWAAKLTFNKITFALPILFHNYLSYFSPQFLFLTGSAEATYGMLPGKGLLYLIELPFLFLFFLKFIENPDKKRLFILSLLFLFPIPASMATGVGYSANRTASMIIPLEFMAGIGCAFAISLLRKNYSLVITVMTFVILISYSAFMSGYFRDIPKLSSMAMGYGWNQALPIINANLTNFEEIRISRSLSEPQIYIAFFNRIDPEFFQNASVDWANYSTAGFKFLDQYDNYRLGSYRFGSLYYDQTVEVPILYVGKPSDFPPKTLLYTAAYYPDTGIPAIVLAAKYPKTLSIIE